MMVIPNSPLQHELMGRWKAICAYDGGHFEGWQRQPHGATVQNHIEAALSQITNCPTRIQGSGRTDAGVHANGQVFHFDADWVHSPEKLIRALHSILGQEIKIRSLRPAQATFHARFSVISKCYHYHYYLGRAKPIEAPYLWACREGPIDLAAMNAAAQAMLGERDFTALSASHGKDVDPNPRKTLYQLQVRQKGPYLKLQVEGSGFLYKMVRSLAGALYAVGRQRLSPDDLIHILHSCQRTQKIVTAPAHGLYLERVNYSNPKKIKPLMQS
jgi:tRNA pseudouridine38-40 synthase